MNHWLAAWVFICGCVSGWFIRTLYDSVKRQMSGKEV